MGRSPYPRATAPPVPYVLGTSSPIPWPDGHEASRGLRKPLTSDPAVEPAAPTVCSDERCRRVSTDHWTHPTPATRPKRPTGPKRTHRVIIAPVRHGSQAQHRVPEGRSTAEISQTHRRDDEEPRWLTYAVCTRRSWPRILTFGAGLWVARLLTIAVTGNPTLAPSLIFIGSFLLPVTLRCLGVSDVARRERHD
jgi:hypothetical protein